MLLRSSIVNTKKFFQKTLNNFKSMFSPGYERLPKTPNHHHHSQFSYSLALPAAMDMDMNSHNHNNPSYEDLEKFYDSFTQQWDSQNEKARKGSSNKKKTVLSSSSPTRQEAEVYDRRLVNASPVQKKKEKKHDQMDQKREENVNQNNKRMMMMISQHQRGKERNWIVEKKLRELEMLDKGNVDHVMDIEEVLHYYSRLTCPAYLEIVEKFFTEMYSEFFGLPPPPPATNDSPSSVKSRLQHRSMRS